MPGHTGPKPPHAMLNRPRLSPKSPNEIHREGYFVPPTPAAADRPQHAWSPFFGGQQGGDAPLGRVDENGEVARAGYDAGVGAGGESALGGAGAAGHASASAGTGQANEAPSNSPWSTTAPPSFTLSPTSTAFNAKFSHALRVPSSSNIPQTPLYPPPSSPFIPENAASTRPAAASSSHPASAVPPTPGPSTTSGLSFPPSSSANSPFKLPTSLAFAGRKPSGAAARPSSLSSSQRTASALPIPITSQRYTLYTPAQIFTLLHSASNADPKTPPILVLDIRTHTAFVAERLAGSINVCVPSTLLRRPAFGIDRVADSLPPSDQEVFERWNSCGVILVLDQESTSLVEGGGPASLLAKFDKAGFEGKLGWVKGGWYAVRTQLRGLKEEEQEKLVEVGSSATVAQSPTTASAPVSAHSTPFGAPGPAGAQTSALDAPTSLVGGDSAHSSTYPPINSKKHGRPVLQVRDLPASAFQLASTSAFRHSSNETSRSTSRAGPEVISPSTSGGSLSSVGSVRPNMGKRRKSGNEGFLASSRDNSQVRTSANPFFDNIRQNSEALSLERSLANLAPIDLPPVSPSLIPSLPSFLRTYLSLSPMSRADRLARQFYELEFAERERLEGTFKWHSRQSVVGASRAAEEEDREAETEEDQEKRWEKFGISAGVELGNLNRFKNIFPYEHARVRLQYHSPSATDYVNASYLSLRNSSKRFIASQGPLPTTFRDFWQMCDQENVGVIIMLTNLQEGGRDKCGRYWASEHEGEWDIQLEGDLEREEADRLKALEAKGGAESTGGLLGPGGAKGPGAGGGGFFSVFDAKEAKKEEKKAKPKNFEEATLRSTITVRRRRQSRNSSSSSTPPPPRKIRHIQYRAWPDFDIPAEPADVVSLVNEVEAAQRAYMRETGWDPKEHGGLEPPILAHCSAGVGRTGVFIMVSSLLAKLRQDHEAATQSDVARTDDSMDIDPPSAAAPPSRPPLAERLSDPETSLLSTGLSLSSLNGPAHSPSPTPMHPSLTLPRLESRISSTSTSTTSSATLAPPIPTSAGSATPASPSPVQPALPPLDVPALAQQDPIFAGVNELREQRMSMVANYRQYVSVLECVLEGAVRLFSQDSAKSS
ncbi:Tyrosine-protein phosphatase 3 [Rhodotorula toruloides]|uniref:protein-tyrosine-phosphatase n=1 Tax=Rhodotorula toruloides TaxID=5286 RepID=A0A0K3CBY6_RHOTO|nr:Tyrosine-protein phosphatase 3 [Rhodotorula toruloides]